MEEATKNQVQEKILETVTGIQNELSNLYQSGKDLAVEQLPEIAKEMIYLAIAREAFEVLVAFIPAVILTFLFWKAWKVFAQEQSDNAFGAMLGSGLIGFVLYVVAALNIPDTFAPIFAPRVFIIQEALKMMGK